MLQLSPDALARHYFPGMTRQVVLPGGSANLMLQIHDSHSVHILRAYLRDDRARFAVEVGILQRLSAIGAPTPRIADWGWHGDLHGGPYLIYPEIPGAPLDDAAECLDPAQLADVVGRVARTAVGCASSLPAAQFGYLHVEDPETNLRRSPHDVQRYRDTIVEYGLASRALVDAAQRAANDRAHLLVTDYPAVVHSDLKPSNVVVHDGGIGLLDWELPVGGHPMLAYGGLLAEGVLVPALRRAIECHLSRLSEPQRTRAVLAGLLRGMEAMSYLPTNATVHNGQKVRIDEHELTQSISLLTDWLAA